MYSTQLYALISNPNKKTENYSVYHNFYSKKYQFFPIFIRNHWILCVLTVNLSNDDRKIPLTVQMQLKDSLDNLNRSEQAFTNLKRFCKRKVKNDYDILLNDDCSTKIIKNSLFQPNSYDCGPFCIFFLYKFLKDKQYFTKLR